MLPSQHPATVPETRGIRNVNFDNSAGPQHSPDFLHRREMRMGKVLQNLTTHDGIERVIRIRNGIDLDVAQMESYLLDAIGIGMRSRLILDIQSVAFMSKLGQERQQEPMSGSDIEHQMCVPQRQRDVAESVNAPFEDILELRVASTEEPTGIPELHGKAKNLTFSH
jgi:hypothetical protein